MKIVAISVLGIFVLGAIFMYCGFAFSHCTMMQLSAIECVGASTILSVSNHISKMADNILGILPVLSILLGFAVLSAAMVFREKILILETDIIRFEPDQILTPKMRLLSWLNVLRDSDPNYIGAHISVG